MKRIKLSLSIANLMGISIIGISSYQRISKYKIEPWRMMNNQPWEKNKKNQKRKHRR